MFLLTFSAPALVVAPTVKGRTQKDRSSKKFLKFPWTRKAKHAKTEVVRASRFASQLLQDMFLNSFGAWFIRSRSYLICCFTLVFADQQNANSIELRLWQPTTSCLHLLSWPWLFNLLTKKTWQSQSGPLAGPIPWLASFPWWSYTVWSLQNWRKRNRTEDH